MPKRLDPQEGGPLGGEGLDPSPLPLLCACRQHAGSQHWSHRSRPGGAGANACASCMIGLQARSGPARGGAGVGLPSSARVARGVFWDRARSARGLLRAQRAICTISDLHIMSFLLKHIYYFVYDETCFVTRWRNMHKTNLQIRATSPCHPKIPSQDPNPNIPCGPQRRHLRGKHT